MGALQRSSVSALTPAERRILAIGAATGTRAAAFALRTVHGFRLAPTRKRGPGGILEDAGFQSPINAAASFYAQNPGATMTDAYQYINNNSDWAPSDIAQAVVAQAPAGTQQGSMALISGGGRASVPAAGGGSSDSSLDKAGTAFLGFLTKAAESAPKVIDEVNVVRGKAPPPKKTTTSSSSSGGVGLAVGLGLFGLAVVGGILLSRRAEHATSHAAVRPNSRRR